MLDFPQTFDVIVIGGGHAGTEAALAAARVGASTLLLTQSIETIGQMSCNPAIGGIGKGQIVREIDALGGIMAQAADKAGIQFRTLNSRKGPAVRATRAQADRALYRAAIRAAVEAQPNLQFFQQSVDDLIVDGGEVRGVRTQMGLAFYARSVVLTTGTFLGGLIHVGDANYGGGRAGDAPANALATRLRAMPFRIDRLKTGTPPRIDARSVDFNGLEAQPGDDPAPVFSFMGDVSDHPEQVPCHITHTNERTHDIIRGALDRSPLFSGAIEGTGPRYCPSVEDKIVRFADKTSHQIFVEPEGLTSVELYPNGISTSLPFDVQWNLVRTIKGFEQAVITRPGYAIEYDYLDPRDLHPSLESKIMPGLFLAGQINGTTGYEEAAGQGLIAGVNAARRVAEQEAFALQRHEAYIGVMIDDLITRGTSEPYRMFTSRAEYRLQLREDNADLRLTPLGRDIKLVDDERWRSFEQKREAITSETQRLEKTLIRPGDDGVELALGQPLTRETHAYELLRRPEVDYLDLMKIGALRPGVDNAQVAVQLEIQARYSGYIDRAQDEIARQQRHEAHPLPVDFDYLAVRGLSAEVLQKLQDHRPTTIGQAGRISGVTPAAISLLLVHVKRRALSDPGDTAVADSSQLDDLANLA